MVTRRQFTVTLVLTPIAAWLGEGCGGSDGYAGSSDGNTSSTNPTIACDGLGAESSVAQGHTHELCVPANDLASPPLGGATYATTTTEGHLHRVTIDAAGLGAINRGETIRVTSTTENGHVHSFSLARAGTISTPPQPGGTGTGSGGY